MNNKLKTPKTKRNIIIKREDLTMKKQQKNLNQEKRRK
jgi:hypothetical protein